LHTAGVLPRRAATVLMHSTMFLWTRPFVVQGARLESVRAASTVPAHVRKSFAV